MEKFSWPKSWRQVGSWSTAPLIHNLGAMWRQVFIFMPRALYPRERKLISFNSGLPVPQRPCWRFGEKTNLLSPPGFEIWIIQHLAWSLHRRSYPISAYFRKGRKIVHIIWVLKPELRLSSILNSFATAHKTHHIPLLIPTLQLGPRI